MSNIKYSKEELKNMYCSLACMNDNTIKYNDYKNFLEYIDDDIKILNKMVCDVILKCDNKIVMNRNGKLIYIVFSNDEKSYIVNKNGKISKTKDISHYHKLGYKLQTTNKIKRRK